MTKLACASVGGPECTHEFEAENYDGFLEQAHAHFKEVHPEVIANVTDEQKAAWMTDSKTKFEAASAA